MSKKVKIGVIGAGMGAYHVQGYQQCPDAEVLALSDINEEKGKKISKEKNIPFFYTDYRDLLRMKELDAVSVCTPNCFHSNMTIEALNAGKDVLCEKPMAMNAKNALLMVKAAKANKKLLMIGFSHRFRSDSQCLKEFINNGRLGEIYHVQAFAERRRGIPGLGSWFTTKSMAGGGPLIDIGVHILDLCLWLIGDAEPSSVTAAAYSKFMTRKDYTYVSMWGNPVPGGKRDVEDLATAWVRFKNGATLSLEASWASNIDKDLFYAVIMGDKGGAKIELGEPLKIFTEEEGKIVDITPKYPDSNILFSEMEHFVECVRTRKKPIPDGEAGVRVQKLIDGIYLSSGLKKEVAIK
ncbi:MAG: Gfo/Idh/MocA family oxidoreductase [Candidatus Omnitrophica bacterium]|nr:Gfo/Idh/MocA family oxidoreductase [Candidatus Omnitrophota bacterium]